MKADAQVIKAVPTNIITGFLGVGKTTAILHLLERKSVAERWAVLVNEFGEIGVDGSLFQGQYQESGGVFVREVPGGCMCCAAGLPMQIALNQLLARARPHRLLIEPTGLGHPKEVLEVLMAEHYREVLDVQKCVTLVDARKLNDPRYTGHDTFNQQIDIADLVVGNKVDLYQGDEKALLTHYIATRLGREVPVVFTRGGLLEPSVLQGRTAASGGPAHHHHPSGQSSFGADEPLPASGYLKVRNTGEGFQSLGWRFSPTWLFSRRKLYGWLSGLKCERIKAVFITDDGVYGYNLAGETLTEIELDDCLESKIEILVLAEDQFPEVDFEAFIAP